MIEALDHIAIAVRDLDRAASAFGMLLGRRTDWRAARLVPARKHVDRHRPA
jgi:catechol 2,3-dioxygenase-like lactoylglutathione lyase family enzyme